MGNLVNLPNISADVLENLNFDNSAAQRTTTFDAKNYLNVRLDSNEDSREIRIRLLPMDLTNGNPFVQAHFHSMKVPTEISKSGYKSFLCLHKNKDIDHEKFGDKCPFCELNKSAYEASVKETDPLKKDYYQKISLANLAKDAVIVRCIERGAEADGVKFWKFNLSRRKDDPYHTIMDLYNSAKKEGEAHGIKVNILDIYEGRDLIINLKRNKDNKNDVKTTMTISTSMYPSPLSQSEEEMQKWIYDEKKWTEVFTAKPYEYLKLVSENRVPWYDRTQGKWVDKAEFDSQQSQEVAEVNSKIDECSNGMISTGVMPRVESQVQSPVQMPVQAPVQASVQMPANDFVSSLSADDDDDLPF